MVKMPKIDKNYKKSQKVPKIIFFSKYAKILAKNSQKIEIAEETSCLAVDVNGCTTIMVESADTYILQATVRQTPTI